MKKVMKTLPSVSVCIPSYEVAESLVTVLDSIYKQSKFDAVCEVLVAVDGKSMPVKLLKMADNPKLRILEYRSRQGQSHRINDLFRVARGDIVILTNDDVIWGGELIVELLKVIESSDADFVAAKVLPLEGKSLLNRVLKAGWQVNESVKTSWSGGDNYLACNGRLVALKKTLSKKIRIPELVWNNDAFLYLYVKTNKKRFSYASKAMCYFKQPDTVGEYLRQSLKYQQSEVELARYFEMDIGRYYRISSKVIGGALLKRMVVEPGMVLMYLLLVAMSRVIGFFKSRSDHNTGYWETDVSTKRLGQELLTS